VYYRAGSDAVCTPQFSSLLLHTDSVISSCWRAKVANVCANIAVCYRADTLPLAKRLKRAYFMRIMSITFNVEVRPLIHLLIQPLLTDRWRIKATQKRRSDLFRRIDHLARIRGSFGEEISSEISARFIESPRQDHFSSRDELHP